MARKNIKTSELSSNEFVARVNKLNQVTLSKDIRDKHDIEEGVLIVLEFKGTAETVYTPIMENK